MRMTLHTLSGDGNVLEFVAQAEQARQGGEDALQTGPDLLWAQLCPCRQHKTVLVSRILSHLLRMAKGLTSCNPSSLLLWSPGNH